MDEQDERLMIVRLTHLLQEHPGMNLQLSGVDAWSLLGALQLVCRHPGIGAAVRARIERIARTIQAGFDGMPLAADLAQRGWDPPQDRSRSITQ